MFDLDAGKLIVIGIVALVAIPSKDLPRVLRQLGQMAGRMRRMAAEFQGQFMEAMREAELHELRQEVEKVKDSVKLEGSFDPLAEARKQIMQATEGAATDHEAAPATDAHGAGAERASLEPSTAEPAISKPPQGDAGV